MAEVPGTGPTIARSASTIQESLDLLREAERTLYRFADDRTAQPVSALHGVEVRLAEVRDRLSVLVDASGGAEELPPAGGWFG